MSATDRDRRPAVTRGRRQLLPHQHGAWAFLVLPLLLGLCVAGWSVLLVPLAFAWIASYPFSWAVAASVSMPRPERYRDAVVLWGVVSAAAGLVVLLQRPWLVWVLLVYGAAFAVNLDFARRRSERAIANDLLLVAECSLVVPVAAGVLAGGDGWEPPWSAMSGSAVLVWTVVCVLTLVGSTLHVKSLIRERRDPRYTRASQAFAVASVPVAAALALVGGVPWWAVTVPLALLAGRALWLHDPTMRPGRLGMIELVCFVAVVAGGAAARLAG
ncbi:YwiC-like family protein [Nocardioides panacisoli]